MYIVHNVPESTVFFPKVRGEIASIRWFAIDELPGAPGFKKKKESFFMVNQFIRFVFCFYYLLAVSLAVFYFHIYSNTPISLASWAKGKRHGKLRDTVNWSTFYIN